MVIKIFTLFLTLFIGGMYNIAIAQEPTPEEIKEAAEKEAHIRREFFKKHAGRIYGETKEEIKKKWKKARAATQKKWRGFKAATEKAKEKVAVPIHAYAGKKLGTESERITKAFIDANKYQFNVKDSTPTSSTNVAKTPFAEAKKMASIYAGVVALQQQLPNFQKNYAELQAKCKQAKNIPRSAMPVIHKKQMSEFIDLLRKGTIDIHTPHFIKIPKKLRHLPHMYHHLLFPRDLHNKDEKTREEWLTHGHKDGNLEDDKIKVTEEWIEAKKLIPTQSQLWLSKLIAEIVAYGAPTREREKARGRKTVLVIDKNIIDAHHHWAKIFLTDPNLKVKVYKIHLPFQTGLGAARSFGGAKGNKPQK